MISKRTRRSTRPVEALRQEGFNAVKGIDISKPLTNPSNVLYSKNLDIDTDGGLVLRKPIIFSRAIPEVPNLVGSTRLVHHSRLFDKDYSLTIRCQKTSTNTRSFIRICKSDAACNSVQVAWNLKWNTWKDYSEQYSKNTLHTTVYTDFTDIIDWSEASVTHTPSSTVITNVLVNVRAAIFKVSGDYLYVYDTDLYFSKLYDTTSSSSLFLPRTLVLTKSDVPNYDFVLNIVTPDVNILSNTDTLSLNPNLDLDNAYSIRDTYNSSAPTVHNILMYAPITVVGDSIKYSSTDYEGESETSSMDTSRTHRMYTSQPSVECLSYLADASTGAKYKVSTSRSAKDAIRIDTPSQAWAYDSAEDVYFPRTIAFDAKLSANIVIHFKPLDGSKYGAWIIFGIGDTSVPNNSSNTYGYVGDEVTLDVRCDLDSSGNPKTFYLNLDYPSTGFVQCCYWYNEVLSDTSAVTSILNSVLHALNESPYLLVYAMKLCSVGNGTLIKALTTLYPNLKNSLEPYNLSISKNGTLEFDPENSKMQLVYGKKPDYSRIKQSSNLVFSSKILPDTPSDDPYVDRFNLLNSGIVEYTLPS